MTTSGLSRPVSEPQERASTPVGSVPRSRAPLRIASCINSMSVSGGSELNAVRTAERLRARGHHIEILTLTDDDGGMARRYRNANVSVFGFPVDSLLGRSAVRQVRALARHLRTTGVDIVHTHDCYTNFLMILAARLANVPSLASKRWTFQTFPQHRVTDFVSYHLADAVLANSSEVARTVHLVERVARDRIHVVPNFVDDDAFSVRTARESQRSRFGYGETELVFGIVAQLRAEKNHRTLLRVFQSLTKRHPHIRLLIVGDGPEREDIEALITELKLDQSVHMTGHLSEAWRAFAAVDVAVLPSQHEGFPNSVIEAMAAGLPVVATAVGGIPDAITDGVSGILIPRDSASALREALERLVEDSEFRVRAGTAAFADAQKRYGAGSVIDRLEQVYATVLARG